MSVFMFSWAFCIQNTRGISGTYVVSKLCSRGIKKYVLCRRFFNLLTFKIICIAKMAMVSDIDAGNTLNSYDYILVNPLCNYITAYEHLSTCP